MAKTVIVHTGGEPRIELHDQLGLTGCEVSINQMAAGTETPFVHFHDQNEELYLVLGGSGKVWLDGEVSEIRQGDCFNVEPSVHRCLQAGPEGLSYACIQTKANSLEQFTMTDGKIADGEKPVW